MKTKNGLSTFLIDVRDAVRGKPHDYTSGLLGTAITVLAVPMVLEMVMESVFTVVDIYFVEKLGPNAVATVGLTEQLMTLIYGIAIGLSTAGAAMVARRIGEKNEQQARIVAVQAIIVALLVSMPLAAIGIIYDAEILRLMGADEDVVQLGSLNMAIMFGGNATVMLIFVINALLRGAGQPAIAMRVLWIANGINIILDPCLIFGWGPFPELGVVGAAVATNIGRGIGVLCQLWFLFRGSHKLTLHLSDLKLVGSVILRILKVSVWGVVQFLVATGSWLVLLRITANFGAYAIAGYTIALRIISFSILPSWGLANAAATLVGQNMGAGKVDRAQRAVWKTGVYNMVLLGVVTVIFLLFAPSLVGLFTTDPEVGQYGISCLRFIGYGLVFYALGLVVNQSFNGAGDTTTPTWINFICYWLFQIPLAWFFAMTLEMGPNGVFLAITLAQALLAPVAVWAFQRGRWKSRVI